MAEFIKNAEKFAVEAMNAINPKLASKYGIAIRFLAKNPAAASAMRGRNPPEIGSIEYIALQANNFHAGRAPRQPEPPSTVPDELVSFILQHYFGLPQASLKQAQQEHLLSMAAENIVGTLLEHYLASVLELNEWVWCSGSMVKAIDFIKAPKNSAESWDLLQVKNRDNSENSSSSAIRLGTDIKKWHRTFSRKAGANWANFPDEAMRLHLSEAGFKSFVEAYLKDLRKLSSSK